MQIIPPVFDTPIDSPAQMEQAVWCLVALREKLKNRQRSFDDAIVNTCIDLLHREIHSANDTISSDQLEKIEEVLLKNIGT